MILIVEDNPVSVKVIETGLTKRSHEVVVADSGEKALEVLQQHPDVAVVVTDIDMPDLSGLDLLARIREAAEWEDLPVIIVSASSDVETVTQAGRLGVRRFFVKPVNPQDLAAEVDEALDDAPAVLGPREAITRGLGVDDDTWSEMASNFRGVIGERLPELEGFAQGDLDEAALAKLGEVRDGLDEAAKLLGAARLRQVLKKSPGEDKERAGGLARALVRELRAVAAELDAALNPQASPAPEPAAAEPVAASEAPAE